MIFVIYNLAVLVFRFGTKQHFAYVVIQTSNKSKYYLFINELILFNNCSGFLASNDIIGWLCSVKLKGLEKKIMSHFMMLSWLSFWGTEENNKKHVIQVSVTTKIQTGYLQITSQFYLSTTMNEDRNYIVLNLQWVREFQM